MKRKGLFFVTFSTIAMCLASCNFVNVADNKIKSIHIEDSISSYVVGQKYFDRSNLTMTATYTDSHKEALNKEDVTYSLTLGTESYNIEQAFTKAGTYSLRVEKDNVLSNSISFEVYAEQRYVSEITVNGANTVEEKRSINVTLTVSPSSYTVPIEYEIADSTIVSINKNSETSYQVNGLKAGETSVTFKALKNSILYTTCVYHIVVTESTKVNIKQTYNEYVKEDCYNTSSCPTAGDVKLLVIPVWFTDSDSYISSSMRENVRDDLNRIYFGTPVQTGWHSVSSYYEEESMNSLHLTGTVSDWYECGYSATTLGHYSNNQQKSFVKATVNWYFNNHADSRTNYDSDGDGYLDGVMLIYAAPDSQVLSTIGDNMWAYCYFVEETSQKNVTNPGVNVFFWASYDFMYGANTVLNRTGKTYSNGDTNHCSLDAHTYIHEMGHVFGLEDYYDYSGESSPAAGFSMQDNNVGGHEGFSALSLGWADPYIPDKSCEITIYDFQSSHDLILLTPEWNAYDSAFDEYLLLELYTPTELNVMDCTYKYHGRYPQGPKTVGIRLWHVDARLYTTSKHFTTNVYENAQFATAFNNTYLSSTESSEKGRDSFAYSQNPMKIDYQRFDILHIIRKTQNVDYKSKAELSANDLFTANSSFNMANYKSQFYKGNSTTALLDSGKELGWSFNVKSINNVYGNTYSATIQLTFNN